MPHDPEIPGTGAGLRPFLWAGSIVEAEVSSSYSGASTRSGVDCVNIDHIIRRFENPDETRTFELGRFELVQLGGLTIGRASYEPGWKWSTHVRPTANTPSCAVEHVGLVLSGRCRVAMDDGTEFDLTPGDLFYVKPGHHSWVLGKEPYVSLHFLGADSYAAKR